MKGLIHFAEPRDAEPQPPLEYIRRHALATPLGVSQAFHLPVCESCTVFDECLQAVAAYQPFARVECEMAVRDKSAYTRAHPCLAEEILALLQESPEPLTGSQIAARLDSKGKSVWRSLGNLHRAGRIEHAGMVQAGAQGQWLRLWRLCGKGEPR